MAKKSKDRISEETANAYHEAGHAVVSVKQKLLFKRVTIVADEGSVGCTQLELWGDFRPEAQADLRTRDRLQRYVSSVLAGPAAEERLLGKNSYDGAGAEDDWREAFEQALRAYGSPRQAKAYLELLYIVEQERMREPSAWAAVRAVAKELLKQKTLTAKQVRALVDQSM